MNPEPRIRVLPPEKPAPQIACLPVDYSRRWYSPFEEKGIQPVVSVFLTQNAYGHVSIHSSSETDDEVGGVLVGMWCQDAETSEQFIVVETALPARYTRQGSVYLTFTQDSLVDFHTELEEHFPGKRIVGWYHTHPRMGVFLSHYDIWLHQNFFPEPWQVALVVEPHSAVGGFFIRQADGEFDPSRYFGFYELNGNFERSVVHWRNLHQTQEEIE